MSGPPILQGCDVLPPMAPATNGKAGSTLDAKTKGKGGGAAKRTAGDRFAVLNAFVDFTLAELDRGEIAVWLTLYRDARDGVAQVSQVSIARRAGISERAVRKALGRLKAKGLVKIVRQGRIGKGASIYRIRPLPPRAVAEPMGSGCRRNFSVSY